jgi:hypothetical protein
LNELQKPEGEKRDIEELKTMITEALNKGNVQCLENGLKVMANGGSANLYFADHATASLAQELLMEHTDFCVNFRRIKDFKK